MTTIPKIVFLFAMLGGEHGPLSTLSLENGSYKGHMILVKSKETVKIEVDFDVKDGRVKSLAFATGGDDIEMGFLDTGIKVMASGKRRIDGNSGMLEIEQFQREILISFKDAKSSQDGSYQEFGSKQYKGKHGLQFNTAGIIADSTVPEVAALDAKGCTLSFWRKQTKATQDAGRAFSDNQPPTGCRDGCAPNP